MSCFGPMAAVANVMVKRRGFGCVMETSASDPLTKHRNPFDDVKTGVSKLLREEQSRYLPTGYAMSGV